VARIFILAVMVLTISGPANSRTVENPKLALLEKGTVPQLSKAVTPIVEYTAHNRGNIQLAIANNGTFGTLGRSILDPFTGEPIPSCIYPKNSDLVYLWVSAIWIGAIVGRDTLVSVGDEDFYVTRELWPDVPPFGEFEYKSIDPSSPFFDPEAYSEEDIICEYTDTIVDPNIVRPDPWDQRAHRPLGIKVTQRSMAWSYSYADDFILFDYRVKNISPRILRDVYLGIWVDGDVWHTSNQGPNGWNDDAVGFYRSHPSYCRDCEYEDSIRVAYHVDNDGDPDGSSWNSQSTPHAVGVRVVRTPADSLDYSFNWWIIDYGNEARDFGPRQAGTPEDPFRSLGGRLGTPEGDRNKYYLMRHNEFDYDLLYTAMNHTLEGWLAPPQEAELMASGYDCRYLLSFGPFDIHPGQSLPISFAWVGGENYHASPSNYADYFDPYNPDALHSTFDFSEMAANSRWASWVYDNPGVDTDGDGYRGEPFFCVLDSALVEKDTIIDGRDTTIIEVDYTAIETCWVEGDGVPDFVGAGPPPAPKYWVEPDMNMLRIRFNGLLSETTRDVFSNIIDFGGYRVYLGRDDRPRSLGLMASYDIENYNRLVLVNDDFILTDIPFTMPQLQATYGDLIDDPDFDPMDYTRSRPYVHPLAPESLFIFERQDYNSSRFGIDTPIRKRYPNQPYPTTLEPTAAEDSELTDDGYLKYFEYEIVLGDLLPSVPYWVNVTTFDFGSPVAGLPSLETSYLNGLQEAFAVNSADEVEQENLQVYVYPNPYRIDGQYELRGLEDREETRSSNRSRLLHFGNLPHECTITIFSIDGDLIKEIEHAAVQGDPRASHESWDLITRNRQALVSGLYYYVVEANSTTSIGKFAVVM
jgi:hypothetical protein